MTREEERLADSQARRVHWRRWGPFLAERQWGTVREDYSPDGDVWRYFTHDQSGIPQFPILHLHTPCGRSREA